MSDNPFHDAIQPTPSTSIAKPPRQHFFHDLHEAERLRREAANMTRQQQFDNGLIGVEDLDDEELRYGRCRDHYGRIPKVTNKTATIPRDLYDAMIEEHEKRTDEKLRQQLDTAIDTMVGIMADDTCEPKDRFESAKYLFERVKGKTPERVHVATGDKAPWEEVFTGIANITRQQSLARRNGVIDAEVVEDSPDQSVGVTRDQSDDAVYIDNATWEPPPSPVFAPPTPAPTHENPHHSSPEKTNAQLIREQQDAAIDLAQRRKAAKDKIKAAKARRIIKRTMGVDVVTAARVTNGESPIAATQSKLTDGLGED